MGVDIEVIKSGNGTTFPKTGNKVTCHYILTLKNGKKVDSSRDRGRPFEFNVGRGEVIAGWDEGLTKMSLGERAKLTISAVSFCFHNIVTGKSFSEALIHASTNPQYDKRLFIELQVQYMKIASSEHVENSVFADTEKK